MHEVTKAGIQQGRPKTPGPAPHNASAEAGSISEPHGHGQDMVAGTIITAKKAVESADPQFWVAQEGIGKGSTQLLPSPG